VSARTVNVGTMNARTINIRTLNALSMNSRTEQAHASAANLLNPQVSP
jgi:hypothetical protein